MGNYFFFLQHVGKKAKLTYQQTQHVVLIACRSICIINGTVMVEFFGWLASHSNIYILDPSLHTKKVTYYNRNLVTDKIYIGKKK